MPTVTQTPTIVYHIPAIEEAWQAPESTPEKRYPEPPERGPRPTKQPKAPNPAGFRKRLNCHAGHLLTDQNVYVTGNKRRCRICQKLRAREYRQRQNVSHTTPVTEQ